MCFEPECPFASLSVVMNTLCVCVNLCEEEEEEEKDSCTSTIYIFTAN